MKEAFPGKAFWQRGKAPACPRCRQTMEEQPKRLSDPIVDWKCPGCSYFLSKAVIFDD